MTMPRWVLLLTATIALTACGKPEIGLTLAETPNTSKTATDPTPITDPTATANPGAPAATNIPVVVAPAPLASLPAGSPTIALTYYTLTQTRTPFSNWITKTYTATGHCVVYLTKTYCWDDDVKVMAQWSDFNGNHYGPYRFTYWNMSQNATNWTHNGGDLVQDLMLAPRYISPLLGDHMLAGSVSQVMTAGAAKAVNCAEVNGKLECIDFSIDLNQIPL